MYYKIYKNIFIVMVISIMCLKRYVSAVVPEEFDSFDNTNYNDELSWRKLRQINATRKCARECLENEQPKICYYRFTVEQYHVLGRACGACPWNLTDCYRPQCVSADGVERGILTVNRKLPGPLIQVCLGDRVIVDVRNLMPGRTTTIHWHGILQKGSPFMDGVPMITQCPIYENNIFRYDFIADKPGTHMWHSHDGFQKLDGLVGAFIVKQPRSLDPNTDYYDYDIRSHVMVITDWMHLSADQKFPGLRYRDPGQNADSYLINGRGRYSRFGFLPSVDSALPRTIIKKQFSKHLKGLPYTPLSEFHVEQGGRYRFRVISGTSLTCPIKLTVENHTMLVIAADGTPVEPVRVDAVVLFSGERYDFVLEAIEPVGIYWIHVKGLGFCGLEAAYQVAILKYFGASKKTPQSSDHGYVGYSKPGETVLNPVNANCGEESKGICVSQLLSALSLNSDILKKEPDVTVTLNFRLRYFSEKELFRSRTYHRFLQPSLPVLVGASVNNFSFISPPSPILSQLKDIPPDTFCPSYRNTSTCNNSSDVCECFNVIKIPLNAVVEFILVDRTPIYSGISHSFHIHGHDFMVMEQGTLTRNRSLEDASREHKKRISALNDLHIGYPVLKDTLAIPQRGYAIVRIKANNPGFWFFHCHFIYHAIIGMAVVIQVGEQQDLPRIPKRFPKCGDFLGYD